MPARNRALWLTLGALLVPLPALALPGEDGSGQADAGPAALSVSSSLGSCGLIDTGIACQVNISFNSLPNATSYTATITSPDGSVTDLGGVSPGGASAWVPYVGSGTYGVQVTAYGTPIDPTEDSDGRPDVVATGVSPPQAGEGQPRVPDHTNQVDAGSADGGHGSDNADGAPEVETGAADDPTCTETPAPTPEPTTPAPEPTTPAPPTGTTGPTEPAEVDPAAAGKRGVADAAASVAGGDTSVTVPLAESSSTDC